MGWKGVKKQINIENIKSWCDDIGIYDYTINSQGQIDVNGNVNLVEKNFKELPYKFGKVIGGFNVGYNPNLISLKNCPDKVGGWFACNKCTKLDSLEGCPKEVGTNFYCDNCKRKFTKEEVMSLCEVSINIYTT